MQPAAPVDIETRGVNSVDRSFVTDNQAARARLTGLIAKLGEGDFEKPVGHDWNVTAALAHIAYWDRRTLANFEEWERSGVKISPPDADRINDDLLPEWLAAPPAEVCREVLGAAEAVDRKIEALPADLLEAVLSQRPRAVFRSRHRHMHLDEIESALQEGRTQPA